MDQEKLINLQLQMKQNNDDYKEFLDGIESWSEEIKEKEKKLVPDSIINSIDKSFPIRNSAIKVKKNKEKKIKAYDYNAWDKFDVEKALNESEYSGEDEESMKKKKIEQLIKEHREVGNIRFKEGAYSEATSEYTRAISLDSENPILYTNRAMSLIKMGKYEAAEVDCCRAIELDITSVKAFYRRAKCRNLLQRNEEALYDLYAVLKLDPQNKIAQKEVIELEKKINIRGVVEPIFGSPKIGVESSKPLVQINIVDVDPTKHLTEIVKGTTPVPKETIVESPVVSSEMPSFSTPTTATQLLKDLSKYRRNPLHRAKYVSLIDRNMYRKLIGHSLGCQLLQDFIEGLSFSLQNCFISPEDFVASINSLASVARFWSLWSMMSDEEKCGFKSAVSLLDPHLASTIENFN